MKLGLWSMVGCTAFGFLPLVIAVVTGIFSGRKAMDEITSGGTWLWLMNISLPLGFMLGIIGFVLFLTGLFKARPNS